MMKKAFTLLYACVLTLYSAAQTFQIGTANLTITDPTRGRSIPLALYYPANVAGAEVPVANVPGGFPVVSFGHGFVIGTESYSWLWQALVPMGYIVVFPKTEGQLLPAPDHAAFGADIAFCAREVVKRGQQPGSPLFGKVRPRIALMGHSMGGGATYLGAAGATDVTTTITFAAAETNPSSIAAALQHSMPGLVIAAAQDCVTPAQTNQLPMYNNLPGTPKAYVRITGASHCNFTDGSASACYLGETFSCFGFGPFTSRAVQHTRTLEVLVPWLDTWLKDNCAAAETFAERLGTGAVNNWWTFAAQGTDALACPDACGVPGNFALIVSGQGATLTWDAVPFAQGYTVQYRPVGGSSLSANVATNAFTVQGSFPPGAYEYRVRAACPVVGSSAWSAWQQVNAPGLQARAHGGQLTLYTAVYEPTMAQAEVYSIGGQLVLQRDGLNVQPDAPTTLPAALVPGLYVVRLAFPDGGIQATRFVVH